MREEEHIEKETHKTRLCKTIVKYIWG